MRGICLSKENALFFGIALRHMNSVYNKPAQEVAPTGSPGGKNGTPEISYVRESRDFSAEGGIRADLRHSGQARF